MLDHIRELFRKLRTATDLSALGGEAATDVDREIRLGIRILLIALGGFVLWAVFAPLDEGVPTQGVITIDAKRKPVQHLQGGVVREVLAREGQVVEKDQVLIRLADAVARANFEAARQRYLGLRAMENRLLAEQMNEAEITFHEDLIRASDADPVTRQNLETQRSLLRSRREALRANVASLDNAIQGNRALLEGYAQVQRSRAHQLALYREELRRIAPLVEEGYAPRNRRWELERAAAEIDSQLADVVSSEGRTRQTILDLEQRIILARSEYAKEVETQLAEVRQEVEPERERLAANTKILEGTEIRAPVAGQVVGLTVQSVDAVIQPGQKLMDVVPQNEALMLESKVPPHLIDRIAPGDPVDVRFSTFAHSPQLVVDGRIISISGDVISEQTPMGPQSFYLARVEITPEGMKVLGKRQLQPGMPVEAVVKTGSRTLLTYILHPLLKRMAASLKEE